MFKFLVAMIIALVLCILLIKITSMIAEKISSWKSPEWFDKFIDWLFTNN